MSRISYVDFYHCMQATTKENNSDQLIGTGKKPNLASDNDGPSLHPNNREVPC